MALAMRMTRGGRRNRPFYRIVVADKRMPRDGRFIEKLGTYDPLIANDDKRVVLNAERIKFWLEQGAQPSPRVARFLAKAGLGPQPEISVTPQKSAPKAKAQERVKEKEEKKKAAEEAAKAAAAAPAAEAAPEAPAAEAPAADAPAAEEKTEG